MSRVGRGLENSTFKPALILMSGKAVAFGATFFVPVLLTRVFTPAEFGTYKQFFLIVTVLYGIAQIGMAESLYYFLPSSGKEGGRYVVNSLLTLGTAGLMCAVILVAAGGAIGDRLSNPALIRFIPIAGATLLFLLFGSILEIVLISRKHYQSAAFSYMTSDLVRGACLLIPGLVFGSVQAVLLGGLLFSVARATVTGWYVRQSFRSELRPDAGILREQLAYALPFAAYVLIHALQANYHHIAVSSYFDAATFAIYSIGCLQIPLVEFLASPACNVMMVRMREHLSEGDRAAVVPVWHDTTRKLALVFFPLVALLVVNAEALITFLFTEQYLASVPVFMVWSLSVLIAALQTDGIIRVFARTRFLILTNLIRLVTIVTVMGWFLRNFNLVGAVAVMLMGMGIEKILALAMISRLLERGISGVLPWKSLGGVLLAAMSAAIPVLILNTLADWRPFFLLAASGLIFAAGYAGMLQLLGILTDSEKQVIRGYVLRVGQQLGMRAVKRGSA